MARANWAAHTLGQFSRRQWLELPLGRTSPNQWTDLDGGSTYEKGGIDHFVDTEDPLDKGKMFDDGF